MDFLSSLAKGESKPDNSDQKPSNSDLFASAKLVADAAQAQFRNEPDKYDKAKVAGATADLLDAASQYGKLDETKGVGKYVDQAENYLRQYNTTTSTTAAPPAPAPAAVPDSTDNKTTTADTPVPDSGEPKPITTDAPAQTTTTTETTEKPSGGGPGDYVKLAEGLLNKASEEKTEGSSQTEGGYGDLMKMAGGFLKK